MYFLSAACVSMDESYSQLFVKLCYYVVQCSMAHYHSRCLDLQLQASYTESCLLDLKQYPFMDSILLCKLELA